MSEAIYKRVLLKLGGESLVAEEGDFGLDEKALKNITEEIRAAKDLGVEIAIVIGGGNILRGASLSSIGIERTTGDYMGMLATVINALALQAALEQAGIATRVQTAIEIQAVAEAYVRRKGGSASGKRTCRYFCRRNRQPLFYYRYCSLFKSYGSRSRCNF